jgi:hypothetical protein
MIGDKVVGTSTAAGRCKDGARAYEASSVFVCCDWPGVKVNNTASAGRATGR